MLMLLSICWMCKWATVFNMFSIKMCKMIICVVFTIAKKHLRDRESFMVKKDFAKILIQNLNSDKPQLIDTLISNNKHY